MIKLKELLSERRNNWLGEAKASLMVKLYKSAEKDFKTYVNKINRISRELSMSSYGSIQTQMSFFHRDAEKIKDAITKGIVNSKKAGVLESVNEKVARPFSQHLRNAQEEVEYMIQYGPEPDGDDSVYDDGTQAMKLLSVAQKALGKIK